MNELIIAFLLGIVEGITEFLPISSTGHLILINNFLSFTGAFPTLFDVVIQCGAILAVLLYLRKKILPLQKNSADREKTIEIWKKILISVLPALLVGGLFGAWIQETLFTPLTVAIALFVGGVFLLLLEKYTSKEKRFTEIIQINYSTAFFIGLIQCFALIPGTSRAAATIIGAMLLGADRKIATEYSFFLAIPTLIAASGYSLFVYFSDGNTINTFQYQTLALGFIVSFITAWLAIAWLMKYVSMHDFKLFGYYRIILAVLVLFFLI